MTSELSTPGAPNRTPRPDAILGGNPAASELAGVLANDPTTVTVRCGNCGDTQAFAQLRAYLSGPGTALVCRTCDAMVARVARTPQGAWLDLSGASSWLFLPSPQKP